MCFQLREGFPPDALRASHRGAHVRRFPKHRFLLKCLSIPVDHRPDPLARRFRIGMYQQQHLCPFVPYFAAAFAPLSLGVPHCHPIRKSRRNLIAKEDLPFEFADRSFRACTTEVERGPKLRRGRSTGLQGHRLCRRHMNRNAANYYSERERARAHPCRDCFHNCLRAEEMRTRMSEKTKMVLELRKTMWGMPGILNTRRLGIILLYQFGGL